MLLEGLVSQKDSGFCRLVIQLQCSVSLQSFQTWSWPGLAAEGRDSAAEPVGVVGGAREKVCGGSEAGDAVRAGGCHQEAEGLTSPLAMVSLALVVVLGLHSFIYYLWELVWSRRLKDCGRWGLGGN